MSYTKYVYNKTNWINKSEGLTTPIGKERLNNIENGIYNIAENLDVVYNEISTGKFDAADAGKVIIGMPTWDATTGILVFQFYDGTQFSVDFNIEKIPVSFSMDSAGVITMTTEDGTEWTADIGEVIPDYTFQDSDRITFTRTKETDGSYTVTADLKKNSITGDYLQPNYLTDITTQASNAAASATQASGSADNADYDAKLAQSYAVGGSGIRQGEANDNALYYNQQAAASASDAFDYASEATDKATATAVSEANAKNSESSAATSAAAAETSETNAAASAASAAGSATTATNKASEAVACAQTASTKASDASDSAVAARSYTHGGTGTRTNENTDNAQYYYNQAKSISESFAGALRPMGTVTFANLPALSIAVEGDMYNISDQFIATADFKEGTGNVISAGSNVYKTSDGYWDILAGTPVTSVNGSRGDVSITPGNIGALPVTGGTLSGHVKTSKSNIGYYLHDSAGHNYPGLFDNGTNLWVGAAYTLGAHHTGGTYISSGFDSSSSAGNATIYICVPNSTNDGGTNYPVLHSGNYGKYVTKLGTSTVGGEAQPIYFNKGVATPCTSLSLDTTGNAATATKATRDSEGQQIDSTYIKSLSASGITVTYTRGDGTTGTFDTQDTTYSAATTSAAGLMSAADKTMMTKLTAGINKTVANLSTNSVTWTGSSATPHCCMYAGQSMTNLIAGHTYTVIVVVKSITATSGATVGMAVSTVSATSGATLSSTAPQVKTTGIIGGLSTGAYIGTCSVPQGITTMYAIPIASYGGGSATAKCSISLILLY